MSFDFYMHEWTEVESGAFSDCFARIKLLTKDNSDEAKGKHKELVYGNLKVKPNVNPVYKKGVIDKGLNFLDKLDIRKPSLELAILPPFSFSLQFTFTLATPYLSKDDDVFYPCENPIRKDKVFKIPMVAASTWKGNMRWTARQKQGLNAAKPDTPDTPEIIRLFGNEKRQEKEFNRGRLNFYPAFFNQIGLEVINPHARKTKAGIQPIYIESVPIGATGTFSLLYIPFDLLGRQKTKVKEEVKKDIDVVCESLEQMMLTYGFSAKKGSGFGVVDKNISGTFEMSRCHVDKKHSDDKANPFSGFDGLKKLMDRVKEVMERGHGI